MAMLHVDMRSGDQRIGISLTGGILMPGRWGHVAFAIDAAGSAKLIVDGAEVSAGIFQGMALHWNRARGVVRLAVAIGAGNS